MEDKDRMPQTEDEVLAEGPALSTVEPSGETIPSAEIAGKIDDLEIPSELPIVPLKDTVIYPFVGAPLAVGQERTLKLIDDAVVGNRLVGFVASKDPAIDNPGPEDAYRVGVVGAIVRMMRLPNGTMQLAV